MAAETIQNSEWDRAPRRRKWTREEFDSAWEKGLFGPEERLELIEGDIIVKMTQNSPHSTGISLVGEALRGAFPVGYVVRVQLPLALGKKSQPDPDVAVVAGSIRDYAKAHPTTAVLVVEVADTSLDIDRGKKAGLYARAGIEEYWIVNIVDRVLEVHRHCVPMSERPLGHYYRSVTHHTESETVSPLNAPNHAIAVADLLP